VSWLDAIQLRDLDAETRLELTCRTCGKVRFVTPAHLLTLGDFGHLAFGSPGPRPLQAAWLQRRDAPCHAAARGTKGFVGGIA
jgi:hypothetical protein